MLTPGQIIMNKKSYFFFLGLTWSSHYLAHVYKSIFTVTLFLTDVLSPKYCVQVFYYYLLEDLLLSQTYYLSKIVSLGILGVLSSKYFSYVPLLFLQLLNKYLFIYLLLFFTLTLKQKKFLKFLQLRQGKKSHIILHYLGHTSTPTFRAGSQ